ncbi:MAG: DUF6754 domain-containing protein [Candidatus Promineifilaceae bacterium]|nr:DUF6754 domain-containing protein [Candidatus Promineifilaceae bacterium]
MSEQELVTVLIIALATALIVIISRRLGNDRPPLGRLAGPFALRPLDGLNVLQQQAGMAVESGRRLHVTVGRAPLHGPGGPSSVAALQAFDYLATAGSTSGVTPLVTVGAATLWPAALGVGQAAYDAVGRGEQFRLRDSRFIADEGFPFVYGAGVSALLGLESAGSNVGVGRFGSELTLIAEAARRRDMIQVLGTDDVTAMAVATAYTDNSLWGEELFAAGAYLKGSAVQLASLRTQDVLRWLLVAILLLVALLGAVGLL